ncbi:MAG: molybdopterin molybdotransferase MoeA [Frankiaceae bacterium]|nr:molybdopterin molybdotransferase MoeA [Frankiaceae bacterium]MBV9871205.1 molybdopterin molybdotransferase MoeA [Frankiaceae bacterium]
MSEALKPVDAHLADILSVVGPLSALDLTLPDAHHTVLTEDVHSTFPLPPFDNSAMDGYAVRAEDIRAASPESAIVLPVVGDVAAGSTTPYTVQPGLCVRIMTGAPIPPGADAVIPLEDTDGGIAQVAIRKAVGSGHCIRRAGEDAPSGSEVLKAGTHLGATQLGLLAAIGRDRVHVRPRPRVVVLSTGSELVEPGQPLHLGQIPDSNSALLTAAAIEAGAIAYRVGIVPDEPGVLADTLEDQLIRADVIVTTGGVSVGTYDVVKEVLSRIGTVKFDRVAMQPGMPQGFGTIGPDKTPFFGLPGNPVSAYVSFEVFVRPALRRMLGVEPIARPTVRARVTEPLRSPPGKRSFLRGWLAVEEGAYVVRPVGAAGSHLIASLAASNALIVVPENATDIEAGSAVSVMMLERRHQ